MTPEDDITFLEDFRDRILRFLIAGTAPSRDPLWGGSGMFEMDKAVHRVAALTPISFARVSVAVIPALR